MNKRSEIYVSIDVETDGPIPGPHSMLSLGAAAFDPAGSLISTFTVNLNCLPDAQPHPDTWAWWQQNLAAYELTRQECVSPELGMQSFVTWLDALSGKPVAVASPAGFDFMFTYWYLIRFVGRSPVSFSCIDVKSVAMTLLNAPYRFSGKRAWPNRWLSGKPHTHVALDDAIEQGESFMLMKREFCK